MSLPTNQPCHFVWNTQRSTAQTHDLFGGLQVGTWAFLCNDHWERWTLSSKKWWFNMISEPKWSYHGDIYRNLPSGAIKHGKNSEVSMRSCWESHIELHGSVDFTIKKYEELTICRWFPWKKHGGYGFSLPCPAPPWVPWGSLGSPAALQPDAKRV